MKRYNMMVAKPYFDKQANQQKTKWVKIGTAVEMTGQDGQMKIFGDVDSTPTGNWWDGGFQLFEQDSQQQGQQPQQQNYSQQQQGQQGYNNQQR